MKKKRIITVNDKMQKKYRYVLTEEVGKNFDPRFKPELTPKEMLALGVFGGVYMRDCQEEFLKDWFEKAIFSTEKSNRHIPELNFFKVNASKPLSYWREKGWIHPQDPRGWFQWYCRYYMGRRTEDDERQIKRWLAIRRHIVQLQKHCAKGDLTCRRRQRQALLHWAYDSRKL
jgi:hypothetical protein